MFGAHMHAMGHRADWKQCSVKLVDFLRHFDGMDEDRMPTFAYTSFSQNKKKKSRSGRKIEAVGDDKHLIFLLGLFSL